MKKLTYMTIALAAMAALAGSCAKNASTGKNDLNVMYYNAWLKAHYPDAPKTRLGASIIEDTPGTGELIGDIKKSPFVYATYTVKDLEGNISATTSSVVSQMLGDYDPINFYGNHVLSRIGNDCNAGINDMLSTMRVGGTRTAVIPGWLMTQAEYDSEEDYIKNVTGTEAIYTVSVTDRFDDVIQWELDSLESYMSHNYPGVDTVSKGFYYVQLKAPLSDVEFENEARVYINYTGKLLNGQAFDTTIQDTAKVHGLYNASRTYSPTFVNWSTDASQKITMGENKTDITEGFSKTISMMKAGEVGLGIFHSAYGYSDGGSGSKIPGYSPLIFQIQILGLNQDGSIDEE